MSGFPQVEGYQIIRNIGKGSTSTVYLAHVKEKTKNMVAIKVIERSKLSKSAQDAVVTEIGVMKKFKHKHIIEMIDFIWNRDNIFIILEYCDGGDLSTYINQHEKLSEKMCCKFMQQLALALQFLRSHNVSHLDLKPQNLLLMKSPHLTLKVGDFGLAKFISEKTQMENIRGSPLYMAPEMLLHNRYDIKADLWSVGVIAYECIYGHTPYTSDSIKDLCEKVKKVLPIEIPSNQVSAECRDLLLGLLKHNPSERMSYQQFFKHPFVDLDHMPTTESYAIGLEAIYQAVKLDSEKQYKAAFCKYCIGLQYLIPCCQNEPDEIKKEAFQIKLNEYTRRADELITTLNVTKIKISSEEKPEISPTVHDNDNDCYPKLTSLCQNTPQLASAVEIALSGQMYLVEGQYEAAVEKYTIGLNLLEKLMVKEPPGIRYNLLIKQVIDWRSQCENAKSLLLQYKDKNVNSPPIDVPDGVSPLIKGQINKKSPKLFRVVSRLVLKTNNKHDVSSEKK